ncbi:Putative nuclease HARBI1 [Trachymyrmex cornetzi]|uniref:Nuclease HARBI1 n=1 Tax=Trachymyrmex cornetzi TaxID=471704 RepID=A0A151K304_9HYME|nr:Putative nuclease HARBI1 [Trachymyrmex cornetzi]
MDTATFEKLLNKVTPLIIKQDTHLRKSIPPAERLSLTLRHLATGNETQESLSMSFRIGQSTVSKIIREVFQALIAALKDEFLRFPSNELEWKVIAQEFENKWNFPNCIGGIDGEHVRIDPPLQSGSYYFNYKGTFSIVLMAVVDANLRFIYVDIGTNGRISDSGMWSKCSLKAHLDSGQFRIPAASPLPGTDKGSGQSDNRDLIQNIYRWNGLAE